MKVLGRYSRGSIFTTKLVIELLWEPRDLWVGCYWTTDRLNSVVVRYDIYVCVVPCFPLHVKRLP